MNGSIIGLIIALSKSVPDTAAQRAEAAAQAAEGYAEQAGSATISMVYNAEDDSIEVTTVGG